MFSHGRSLFGLLIVVGLLALIPHGYGMMLFGVFLIAFVFLELPHRLHKALIRKPLAERLRWRKR
jgi:hypothetical protein